MRFPIQLLLIGPGGRTWEILSAIWVAVVVLSIFIIPRSATVRLAQRLGLGIRPSLGDPGLPPSPKVRKLIIVFNLILFSAMLLSWLLR